MGSSWLFRKRMSPRWKAGSIDPLCELIVNDSMIIMLSLPQDDDDRRLGLGDEHQTFPNHQRGEDDHREVQALKGELSLIFP